MANKVKFNICNVHYALFDKAEEGVIKYKTPVPMPGAVSISLDPNGEPESFYADGIEYYTISNNMGYDGDLEIALIPESFRTDVLMEKSDSNKVLIESSNSETATLHCYLSLMETKRKSVTLCITVQQQDLLSKEKPTRNQEKFNQKHCLFKQDHFQMEM